MLSFLSVLTSLVLVIASLYWAKAVLVPLALALMLTLVSLKILPRASGGSGTGRREIVALLDSAYVRAAGAGLGSSGQRVLTCQAKHSAPSSKSQQGAEKVTSNPWHLTSYTSCREHLFEWR
jgi:hypothetical protein